MYSRRVKINKKKPKPSRVKQTAPGSNWGPRLAIIERERALAGGDVIEDDDEEELYEIHHELVHNVKRSQAPNSGAGATGLLAKNVHSHNKPNSNTGSNPSGRCNNEVDPVLRLGRSSSPNYYYYNYSRRTAPNAASGQVRKISCPEPSFNTKSQLQQSSAQPLQPLHQHHRRASYVLGASSGYCSGSVTTLSTCANNDDSSNFEKFTKPLTLIIPNQEKYSDYNTDKGKRQPQISNQTRKGTSKHTEAFATVEQFSQESFPSSGDDEEVDESSIGLLSGKKNSSNNSNRMFHNPLAQTSGKKNSGILQISTKEIVQIHAPPLRSSPHNIIDEMLTEPETLEMGADDEDGLRSNTSTNAKSVGSAITALVQGITMVYVPVSENDKSAGVDKKSSSVAVLAHSESESERSQECQNDPIDLPELGQHSDDCSGSTISSSRDSGKEPDDSLTSNFILKKKLPDPNREQRTNSALDSLLDSFESVMFKPKPGEERQFGKPSTSIHHTSEQKGIRKRPEEPPPLPPTEGKPHGKQTEKQKSLRFALENLETVLNPSRAESIEDQDYYHQKPTVSSPPKKLLKKVTLSLPGEDNISSRNHELLLNYEELNNCSSEILSCGHVRNDDYSTISSMNSSVPEISDFDDIGSNSNAGDMLDEMISNNAASSGGSGGESDIGLGECGNKNKPNHEPRSVLQQLRDLSRLIRGTSPTKPMKNDKKDQQSSNENGSFFLHKNAKGTADDTDIAKRKASDATDNSADSGKGSGSGSASASGSSGRDGDSSSAEPSPNNKGCIKNSETNGGVVTVKLPVHSNKRLKVATIRGRGGGTRNNHHYAICADQSCRQGADDSCSQHSSCSCQDCCDYRSDCNECRFINNRKLGFPKPSNSEELCSNETGGKVKPPPPPHKTSKPVVSKIVRRTSSRVKGSVTTRRNASLRRSANIKGNIHNSYNNRKPVILDYCDCPNCDLECEEYEDFEEDKTTSPRRRHSVDSDNDMHRIVVARHNRPPPPRLYHEPLLIPVNFRGSKRGSTKGKSKGRISLASTGCSSSSGSISERRKISVSSMSSGISSSSSAGEKISRISQLRSSSVIQLQHQLNNNQSSQLLRQSDAANNGAPLANNPVTVGPAVSSGNLFTIDEANEESVYGESSNGGNAMIIGKGSKQPGSSISRQIPLKPNFQLHGHHRHRSHSTSDIDDSRIPHHIVQQTAAANMNNIRTSRSTQHSHPKCWLAPDATLGWSDLESLYSQNMKLDGKVPTPAALRDECPTCWKELSEMKKNCSDPHRTVDRTKRMFIWLNRRHKEFQAPWWEAKKQASMRWLITKAFAQVVAKDKIPDPFKESKKGKPTKYSLRDDIVKGLVTGKLYCMALDALYRSQQNNYHLSQQLSHWDIIKILSRRGIYIAQPSDMKLTEATLRQKKPIRTAAHIALIEAMMGLYAKEILGRDRIAATLRNFGKIIDPDTNSPERLVISWINTAVTTLKSYILSNAPQQLPPNKTNRWLHLPEVGEIRDLCDGVGVCALFALYCSNDLKIEDISVPESGDTLTIYDSITNHSLVQKLCEDLFPEPIYHLCVTDFLYIHGCMKQNILCFLVDLFVHLEINPILRVNRLTHVPIRVEL